MFDGIGSRTVYTMLGAPVVLLAQAVGWLLRLRRR